jgi:hypothetical protein
MQLPVKYIYNTNTNNISLNAKNNPIKIQRFYFVFLETKDISIRNVLMKVCEQGYTTILRISIQKP